MFSQQSNSTPRQLLTAIVLVGTLLPLETFAQSRKLEALFPSLLDDGQINQAVVQGIDPTSFTLSEDVKLSAYFIGEDTRYRNTIGWYDAASEPDSTRNRNVIWSNASENHSGGSLKIGRSVNLGKFEAGDQLGLYLDVNGGQSKWWKHSRTDDTTYFSDRSLNPDGVSHLMAGVIQDEGLLVLGFNDINGGQGGFDDVSFVVDIGVVNATRLAAGAPEPSEWALMFVGAVTLGTMLYRRRDQLARGPTASAVMPV